MSFNKTKKALVGALVAVIIAGGSFVLPVSANESIAAQIAALMAQIQILQAKLAESQVVSPLSSFSFTSNLSLGSRGVEVLNLQKVLNSDVDTVVSSEGPGSSGNETEFFGPATRRAVSRFQLKHGISPAAGYVGPITRSKLNSLGSPVVVIPPPVVNGYSSLVVSSAKQPENIIAPRGATRIPFTKFIVTAGDSDVTMSSVVVERTGLSLNSSLESVMLLDENGNQIGMSRTLNSLNRANIGEPVVIKAGTSKTFVVGGNRPNDTLNGGTIVSLDVVAINSSASVVGSFPIKGASHTVNANLEIGGVKVSRGSIDPGANSVKEIGTDGYTFSSIKVTAGTSEDVFLKSIKWNQSETAGLGDVVNLKTIVDGIGYDVVSLDGRNYTTIFGDGIFIKKGFSKDVSIKGDIVGGSSRKVAFDIAKRSDLGVVGSVYGYGILPPFGTSAGAISQFQTTEDPWYKGSTVTITGGSVVISSDNTVASQNVAINLNDQVLGGWSVEVRGEPISVSRIIFSNSNLSTDITNITLTDSYGVVLAGPVDASSGSIVFNDSITFPTGITKFLVKGLVGTSFSTGNTIVLSTNPGSQWSGARGQITGSSVNLPSTVLTSGTMTVRAGSLTISASTQPSSQNVVAGSNQFEFAKIILDAGQSGEDVRVTSLPIKLSYTIPSASNLSGCMLFDGINSVTSGGNVKNPSVASGDEEVFVFDGHGFIVPKGTSKTLSLKCNISSGITGTVSFGLKGTDISSVSGMNSGQVIPEVMIPSNGQVMTLASSGSYSVFTDYSNDFNYRVAVAGSEVILSSLRFIASHNEDIEIKQIALQLGNTDFNSPSDLEGQMVTLWDGLTQVGYAQFTTSDFALSTLTSPVVIPKGGVKTITIKGVLSAHSFVSGTPGALISVDYDGDKNGQDGNYGVGKHSGVVVNGSSSDTSNAGVRIFSNVPRIEVISNGGVFQNNVDTYKFVVFNDGDKNMALGKVTFNATSTGGSAHGFTLFADSAPVSAPVEIDGSLLKFIFDSNSNSRIIPAKSSKTFVLRCSNLVEAPMVSETLSISLKADSAYPVLSGLMGDFSQVSGGNLVWSPMTTTNLQANNPALDGVVDWTNGYGLPGFPAVGSDFPIQVWTRSN